jgi:hypothetical protein
MEEIIFTTAYKDINRGSWESHTRSNQCYIDYFYNLSDTITYTLVVYVEDSIKEILLSQHTFRENIIFVDMNSVDTFYKKYLEKDKLIMSSKEFTTKIPQHRYCDPECLYSEYNLINHSKINFVSHTKKMFPNYIYYSWIDFGMMNEKVENVPRNINITLLEKKIIYHSPHPTPRERISADDMLKVDDVYFLGSAFIVFHDLVELFESMWESKIILWQQQHITDDDQNLIFQLYYDSPELFQKIENAEWYGFFRALVRKDT